MSENSLLKKGIILIVIVLFFGANVTYSIGEDSGIKSVINAADNIPNTISRTNIYNGSLSGYVNDTSMNPIEGALVRVYFHGTYEENYSDSNGYYHVTNIPICWCYKKNCTASKEGYETEWVWLSIYENTTYDFVLTPLAQQYDGSLSGYVNDTFMNPIEGARVRVYFHGTYEENYTDSSGYYHVTDIPICYCLKNVTCSKEGYKTEWVLLGITENTTYDFILMPLDLHPVFDGTMGENGWYVSCVTITFVYDPEEIAAVYYTLDGGEETLYTEPFEVCEDGFHELLWRAVDHEGNWSDPALTYFNIDQTPPTIDITWELYYENGIWYLIIGVICDDATSGINRVEFFINDELALTDNTPPFEMGWTIPPKYFVKGLICDRQFDEQNVSFYALIVKIKQYWPSSSQIFSVAVYDNAGNVIKEEIKFDVPPFIEIHMFERFTFPNDYTGRIGLFFINAEFKDGPL